MFIGMFHYRKNPEEVSRAYLYASIAKMEGIDFFFFSSKDVDFSKKVINGKFYDEGTWKKKEFPFPDVIMNVVGPITPKQTEIYNKLKEYIPFTSFPVGTKMSVYNRIKKAKVYSNYLIPYIKIKEPIDVLQFLNNYSKIIIKPISGHHGNQVICIEKDNEVFAIKKGCNVKNMTRMELFDYISQVQANNKILMQKYITCRRKTGESYDIRIHLQKDGEGKWKNTIIYPKIGSKEKITTNLGQGGKIGILKNFLYDEFGEEYYNIKRYLEVFAIKFANHFDGLYNHQFDELGIDIGLDENMKIWIYEVNWRPGQMFIEFKTAKNAVMYASYVAKQSKGGV